MNVSQLERNEIPCKAVHLSTFLCMRNNCTHKETVLSLNMDTLIVRTPQL